MLVFKLLNGYGFFSNFLTKHKVNLQLEFPGHHLTLCRVCEMFVDVAKKALWPVCATEEEGKLGSFSFFCIIIKINMWAFWKI